MTTRNIPAWLATYKSQWLSATKLKTLIAIEDGSFSSWFESVRHRLKVMTEQANHIDTPICRYLVKQVWAFSLAHNVTLIPKGMVNPTVYQRMLEMEAILESERRKSKTLYADPTNVMIEMMHILGSAHEPRPLPGVYFLISKCGVIVYVGQSENVLSRMVGHSDKEFHRVTMKRINSLADRLDVEGKFISLLRPKYNISGLDATYFLDPKLGKTLRKLG